MNTLFTSEEKNKLFEDLWNGVVPKRVPLNPGIDAMCAIEKCGYSLLKEYYDPLKVLECMERMVQLFDTDCLPLRTFPCIAAEKIVGNRRYTYSKEGVRQHENICAMDPEEYPELIKDAEAFMNGVIFPRHYLNFNGDKAHDDALLAESREEEKRFAQLTSSVIRYLNSKYQLASFQVTTGSSFAPMDLIADFMRSFTTILSDIRRYPEMMDDAIKSVTQFEITKASRLPKPFPGARVLFTLHMATFMRQKDFERFWWPGFKDVVDYHYSVGRSCFIFFEDNWDRFMDYLPELPGRNLMQFEHTDPKLAKEKLGKTNVLAGFYPVTNFKFGDIDKVVDDTKRYIDILAPGGGYEFICDKTALRGSDIDDEHVKAVLDTVKTYGVYK